MFYLVGIFRTSSPGDSISSDPERAPPGRQGKEPGYIEVCNRGQVIWMPKVFLWTKENQISQIKEFSAFLCMRRWLLKSVLSYASQLSGPSAWWFSQPELPWVCWREWLQSNDCQIPGVLLPPESLQGSPAHIGGPALLTTVTFLLTDMAENMYFSGNRPQHLPSWSNSRRKPLFQPTCLPSKNVCVLSRFSSVWLFETPWTIAHQAPLSMGFSRQEYWSALPFPSPGDHPNPGIKPMSPTLAGRFFTSSATDLGFITMLTIHVVNYDRRTEELYAVLQFPVQWLLYGSHQVFWGPYLVSSSVHLLNFTLIKNNKILIQRGKCLFYYKNYNWKF